MRLHEASELIAILAKHEGFEGDGIDMSKVGGVWVIALDAGEPFAWSMTINGAPVEVSHGLVKHRLRERGCIK